MDEDPGMVVSSGEVIHLARRCAACGAAVADHEDVCVTCRNEMRFGYGDS